MDESVEVDIRYTPDASDRSISPDELALLESILPDVIHAMMALDPNEAD